MGTAGFHLEMVLKWILTGALKTNPTTHTVQHPLDPSYSVGCFPAMEALSQDNRINILTKLHLCCTFRDKREKKLFWPAKCPTTCKLRGFIY